MNLKIELIPVDYQSNILHHNGIVAWRKSPAYAWQDHSNRLSEQRNIGVAIQGINLDEFKKVGYEFNELYAFVSKKVDRGDIVLDDNLKMQMIKYTHHNGFYRTLYFENGENEPERTPRECVVATSAISNLPTFGGKFMDIYSKELGRIGSIDVDTDKNGLVVDNLNRLVISSYQIVTTVQIT